MPCAAVVPRYAGHLTDQPLRISTIQFDGTNIRVAVKPNYFHSNERVSGIDRCIVICWPRAALHAPFYSLNET